MPPQVFFSRADNRFARTEKRKPLSCATGEAGEAIQQAVPPPPFRESVGEPTRAGDLTCQSRRHRRDRLTVAGQRRTYTGFAFQPAHPGVKAPWPLFNLAPSAKMMVRFILCAKGQPVNDSCSGNSRFGFLTASKGCLAVSGSEWPPFGWLNDMISRTVKAGIETNGL